MNLMIDSILIGFVFGALIFGFAGSIFGWCMAISCVNQRKLIHARRGDEHTIGLGDD